MDVAKALLERKSVRAFLNKPVAHDDIIKILSYASHAPSGTNTQPWEVAVVTGNKKSELDTLLVKQFRDGIKSQMDYSYYPVEQMPTLLQERRVNCGLQMFQALDIKRADKEKRMAQWERTTRHLVLQSAFIFLLILN